MQITFDTSNPKDLQILDALFGNLNLPANGKAQPEVAQNTGTTATGSTLSPEGSGVSGAATSVPSEAAAPAPVKEKATRTKKSVVAETASQTSASGSEASEPAPAATSDTNKPLSLDEVRAALQAFTAAKGVPAGIELLKEFGAGRISELEAGKYADFVAKCEVAA